MTFYIQQNTSRYLEQEELQRSSENWSLVANNKMTLLTEYKYQQG